jgi:hypothetical protein
VVRGGAGVMFSPLIWGTFNNAVANGPTQPFRVIYGKAEAAALGLRFPVYNEDILPLVTESSQTQVSDIFDPNIHAPYSLNALRGPGLFSVDLSFAKNFELSRSLKLQVRTYLFNALNRVNYTSVVTNIEARNFGQLTGAANARAIQLNTRLSF